MWVSPRVLSFADEPDRTLFVAGDNVIGAGVAAAAGWRRTEQAPVQGATFMRHPCAQASGGKINYRCFCPRN